MVNDDGLARCIILLLESEVSFAFSRFDRSKFSYCLSA